MLIVEVLNVSNLVEISDYEYEVKVNRTPIAFGTVFGHRRSDGWRALLQRVIEMPPEDAHAERSGSQEAE